MRPLPAAGCGSRFASRAPAVVISAGVLVALIASAAVIATVGAAPGRIRSITGRTVTAGGNARCGPAQACAGAGEEALAAYIPTRPAHTSGSLRCHGDTRRLLHNCRGG